MKNVAVMAVYAALALVAAPLVFGDLVAFDKYWQNEIAWMSMVLAAWYVGRRIAYQYWRASPHHGGGRP
ncbi:MAG: hypothetical protein ACREQN_18315 [Candidatus Binataceae bacterium]